MVLLNIPTMLYDAWSLKRLQGRYYARQCGNDTRSVIESCRMEGHLTTSDAVSLPEVRP